MTALVYQGQAIRRQGEMLSLTDMWRAAGSDPAKKPGKWRELPSSREFIAHIADIVLRKSEDDVIRAERGGWSANGVPHGHTKGGRGGGGTWGHWQVAIAYAKYLSHAFHAWCNDVVRAHMEGLRASPAPEAIEERNLRAEEHKLALVARMQAMKGPAYAFALYETLGLPVAIPATLGVGAYPDAGHTPAMLALVEFAREARAWTGTASALLAILSQRTGRDPRWDRTWPATPRALTNLMERADFALRERGVTVEKRRSMGVRLIEIAYAVEV